MSPSPSPSHQTPTLLTLPREIRDMIFTYLTPSARLPTVLRSRLLGVSSVSHRPPPLALLLTSRQLCTEALDTYFRIAIFRIEGAIDSGNVFCLWQVEEVLGGESVESRSLMQKVRNVEFNLFWGKLGFGNVSGAMANVGGHREVVKSELVKRRERLERVVEVLGHAERLSTVFVTWKEIPAREGEEEADAWLVRGEVLGALEGLRAGIRVKVGDCIAGSDVEDCMNKYVRKLDARPWVPYERKASISGVERERVTLPPADCRYLYTPEEREKQRSYFESRN